MNVLESLRIALTALLTNRLRSILTMLGIVIGVAAVISLVSFGQGFQGFVTGQFQRLGSNLLIIFPSRPGGPRGQNIKVKPLVQSDVAAISNPIYVAGVQAIAPTYGADTKVVYNGNTLTMRADGVTPAWSEVRSWNVTDGRFIEDQDVSTTAHVVVLGTKTVSKLFDPSIDPLGQSIRINSIPFTVVGILETKGGNGNADQVMEVPITTAQRQLGDNARRAPDGEYAYSTIFIKAVDESAMTPLQAQVTQILSERHDVKFVGEEDFMVISQQQILNTVDNVTNLITAFLGSIAGISLIVGGIGVMNIMLVSVTERTREIGLRKAVGARYFDLLLQFLVESVVLSVLGGLIGVLLGALIAFIAGHAIPNLTLTVSPGAVALATAVSIAIGVFFGVYPASRAAALSPIEALRYE